MCYHKIRTEDGGLVSDSPQSDRENEVVTLCQRLDQAGITLRRIIEEHVKAYGGRIQIIHIVNDLHDVLSGAAINADYDDVIAQCPAGPPVRDRVIDIGQIKVCGFSIGAKAEMEPRSYFMKYDRPNAMAVIASAFKGRLRRLSLPGINRVSLFNDMP